MATKHRYGHGLIIGKFLPPHAGHLYLVKEAARQVDHLTILVCSLKAESIPGPLRFQWMRELCRDATIVHVTDENPSLPEEHPDFWQIWTGTIRRYVPELIDAVFTSEDYGDELAQRLGAVHVSVDRERATLPVSGTLCRSDPMGSWDYLPPNVRPHFVRRVVLTGSECTGKTTLASRLAAHYRTVASPEYGRWYVDHHPDPLTPTDVGAIAAGQVATEEWSAREANRVLIQDTDLLSTLVYGLHYFGSVPPWLEEEVLHRRGDLYLLCDLDVPWVADGAQRDRGERREEMQGLFRDALLARGFDWVDIRGSEAERETAAIAAIDRLLGK